MPRLLLSALIALILGYTPLVSSAQDFGDADWEGEWIADGTLFRIGVNVKDGVLRVTQIESMGQVWTNQDGMIEGNVAKVQVDYLGATGIIQAELVDTNIAVLFAASCQPDFMVVCVLSKDRQAIFKKVASPAVSADN